MTNVAILGFGVVGSGVLKIIKDNSDIIGSAMNDKVMVKKILDIRDFSDHEYSELFTKDFDEILNDSDIS